MDILNNIITRLNWLDVAIIVILLRACFISVKLGFIVELFKMSGIVFCCYLSLHYYTGIVRLLEPRLGLKDNALNLLTFFVFVSLAAFGNLVFVLLRKLLSSLMKTEAEQKLNHWGGLILGIARAFLFSSLLVYMLILSGNAYLRNSIKVSYSGKKVLKIAPASYRLLWNNLASKFMAKENFNQAVFEAQKSLD